MINLRLRVFRAVAGIAALGLVCFTLTGCGGSQPDTPTEPQPPQPKVTLKIETCDPDSPMQTRLHKIDELGREFEVEIAYRDKTKGWEIYNPNTGSLVEFKRTHADHKVLRQHAKYSGGKLVWEELYHTNGKVQQRRQWMKNGDRQMTQYVADGTTEVTTLIVRKDGSGELVQRIQDWQTQTVKGMRQKLVWQANGDTVREEYDYQDGKTLLTRATSTGDKLVVEGLRKDGSLHFRQYHTGVATDTARTRPFNSPWTLNKVEMFSQDGKSVERVFNYDGTNPYPIVPQTVDFPLPGGGKRVVECGMDEKSQLVVKGEKVYDANGQLVSEQKDKTDAKVEDLKPDYRWVQPAHNFPRNTLQLGEQWFRR